MSILTYKVKHNIDKDRILDLLAKARKVANLGLKHHFNSSKQVKQIELKSALSNAVMRKYNAQKNIKHISHIVLPVPKESVRWNGHTILITPLNVSIDFEAVYHPDVTRILHMELDEETAYIACETADVPAIVPSSFIGVDVNSTQYLCVAANPATGKVLKLGRDICHIHEKYRHLRAKFETEGAKKKHHKHRHSRSVGKREHNICRNAILNIGNQVVTYAKESNAGIFLENLKGIRRKTGRKTHKDKNGNTVVSAGSKDSRYNLNSWAYYQLQQVIDYTAHLQGIPVVFIDPAYTSQKCSICGELGERKGKKFKCPHCGHADHADVNAAFNISAGGVGPV